MDKYYIDREFIEKYYEYIFESYYESTYKCNRVYKLDDIIKNIHSIQKKIMTDKNFNAFYKKYRQNLEDADPNILRVKLNLPQDEIDVLVLSKLLKSLNIIYEEIANLIGIPKQNLVFKLKNIKRGCLEINILHGVIGTATTVVMTPIIRGLIGHKNLELLENNTELLKEAFFNFLTSITKKNYSWVTSKLKKATIDFYSTLDSIEELKSAKITNSRKSKTIHKNKILDYYA